jgi:glycosyltransferase involved in cell wall biosynthesis
MKVSIAIPVYEMRGRGVYFLDESLKRIKCQDFSDIEVVISDHSQNDDLKNLCEGFKKDLDIRYLKNEEQKGNSSYNLNMAISNCQGEIIKFMMQDEYLYSSNAISIIHDIFLDRDVKWCATSCYYGNSVDAVKGRVDPFYNKDMVKGVNTIGSPSVVSVRNDVIKYFDTQFIWVMDCDYYIRMYNDYGSPVIIKEPLIFVNQHEDQVSSWLSNEIKKKEHDLLEKKYYNE